MADETNRDAEEQTSEESPPGHGDAGAHHAGDPEWKNQIGDSYRRFVSWLSEEIDTLDKVSRERFQGAVSEINDRFPPEERKRLIHSAEREIQEFLGELRELGGRLRRNPNVARIEEKGAEALRTSAARVRQWAQNVEGSLAREEEESGRSSSGDAPDSDEGTGEEE